MSAAPDPDALYAEAQAALAAKDRPRARALLAALVAADPRHEPGWLLLSTVVDDVDQSIDCLQHAVALNPGNSKARHWLNLAQRARSRLSAAELPGAPEADPDAGFVPLDEADQPVPRLGRYLLDYRFITPGQLAAALAAKQAAAQAGQPQRLGEILLAQGALPPHRLAFALREQQRARAAPDYR